MINWKKPELQEEIEEIERTAVDLDIDTSKLFEDAKKGKIIDLSDDIWSKLDNTDSWDIKSIEDARVLADEYDKDIESLIRGFELGKGSIPAPIVLKRQEGGYYLIAGNTRLMVARAFGMIPKILLVEDNQEEGEQILQEILFESIGQSIIVDTIKNRNIVKLDYHGKNPGGSGMRTVEPVCLGYNKRNRLVLRVWDEAGASHTGFTGKQPLPGWRLLRVDRIGSYNTTDEQFTQARPKYNPSGDRSMSRVIVNADFNTPLPVEIAEPPSPTTAEPIEPTAIVEPVKQLTESRIYKELFDF